MIEDIAEVMDEFKRDIMPQVLASINAIKAEYPEDWQRERRIEYLKTRMEGIVYRALVVTHNYDVAVRRGDNMATRLFLGSQILGAVKTIQKLQSEIIYLKNPGRKNGKGRAITDDMIQRAREYPYEQLVEINRAKMAVCPFHGDKDPSFSIRNNYGYCFGCHWKGDTIDFVIKRDGKTFADAVRSLQ